MRTLSSIETLGAKELYLSLKEESKTVGCSYNDLFAFEDHAPDYLDDSYVVVVEDLLREYTGNGASRLWADDVQFLALKRTHGFEVNTTCSKTSIAPFIAFPSKESAVSFAMSVAAPYIYVTSIRERVPTLVLMD